MQLDKKAILNGYECNDLERKLFTLPVKYGGLGIYDPTERFRIEYKNSQLVTQEIVEKVKNQEEIYDQSSEKIQQKYRNEIKKRKSQRTNGRLEEKKTYKQ